MKHRPSCTMGRCYDTVPHVPNSLVVPWVRVYTVFSFFVFKFANEKQKTNSFFVFESEVRKSNSFFVRKFEKEKGKDGICTDHPGAQNQPERAQSELGEMTYIKKSRAVFLPHTRSVESRWKK